MCTVSMVGDFYGDKWGRKYDDWFKQVPTTTDIKITIPEPPPISKEEFEALKKEVEDMKELLRRAKIYDEKNGEPHCEMEDKVAMLKKMAQLFGVDLSDIFPPPTTSS